jgi:hypothetical protein
MVQNLGLTVAQCCISIYNQSMNVFDIITEIEAGHHDAHLNQLTIAIHQRQLHQRQKAQRITTGGSYTLGATVRFNNHAATSYIRGQTGTIVQVKRSRVVVQLHNGGMGRFETGKITVPTSIIDVVA